MSEGLFTAWIGIAATITAGACWLGYHHPRRLEKLIGALFGGGAILLFAKWDSPDRATAIVVIGTPFMGACIGWLLSEGLAKAAHDHRKDDNPEQRP